MRKLYVVLAPGEFIVTHIDQNYTNFSRRVERKIQKGNRRLIWSTKILPTCEYIYTPVIGLVAGHIGLVLPLLIFTFFYPFVSLADPWVWRKIYGQLGTNNYKTSFLLNLDILYWFAIGWVIGCVFL